MKRKTFFVLVLCLSVIAFLASMSLAAPKKDVGPPAHANVPPWAPPYDAGDLITVLNPLGQPAPVELISPAPRIDTLEEKTVYLVDQGFGKPSGVELLEQIQIWFADNMPSVTTIIREKSGSYGEDDPDLWQEIKDSGGDAMIVVIGH